MPSLSDPLFHSSTIRHAALVAASSPTRIACGVMPSTRTSRATAPCRNRRAYAAIVSTASAGPLTPAGSFARPPGRSSIVWMCRSALNQRAPGTARCQPGATLRAKAMRFVVRFASSTVIGRPHGRTGADAPVPAGITSCGRGRWSGNQGVLSAACRPSKLSSGQLTPRRRAESRVTPHPGGASRRIPRKMVRGRFGSTVRVRPGSSPRRRPGPRPTGDSATPHRRPRPPRTASRGVGDCRQPGAGPRPGRGAGRGRPGGGGDGGRGGLPRT